jgi:hypothetical protein
MKRGSRSHKSQYFPSKRGMKITFTLSTILALTLMSSAIARNVNLFDGNDNQPIVGGTEVSSVIYLRPSDSFVFFALYHFVNK